MITFPQLAFTAILICATVAQGSSVALFASSSETSRGQSAILSNDLNKQTRISLGLSSSQDATGNAEDPKSWAVKLGIRYRLSPSTQIFVDFRRTDESYFFEGRGASLRISSKVWSWDTPSESLHSSLSLKIDFQNKNYSKIDALELNQRSLRLGLSQDLPAGFATGVDYTRLTYVTASSRMQAVLKGGLDATSTDLNDYGANLDQSAVSAFLEWSGEHLTLGLSASRSTSLGVPDSYGNEGLQEQDYTNTEVYADYLITETVGASFSYSSGKASDSSSPANTTTVGLDYSF